jgi:hypothetical protein
MRVQARIAATVQKLADLKNPRPVAYVQQANIGNAVQVNNQVRPVEKQRNELLEQQRNEWLDAGTARAAASSNSALEAVGAVNGTRGGSAS